MLDLEIGLGRSRKSDLHLRYLPSSLFLSACSFFFFFSCSFLELVAPPEFWAMDAFGWNCLACHFTIYDTPIFHFPLSISVFFLACISRARFFLPLQWIY